MKAARSVVMSHTHARTHDPVMIHVFFSRLQPKHTRTGDKCQSISGSKLFIHSSNSPKNRNQSLYTPCVRCCNRCAGSLVRAAEGCAVGTHTSCSSINLFHAEMQFVGDHMLELVCSSSSLMWVTVDEGLNPSSPWPFPIHSAVMTWPN